MKSAAPDLFDYVRGAPVPYRGEPPAQSHSPTSIAAAEQIKTAIGPLHTVILAHLRNCPDGATDEEMQNRLDMPANTQRPRRRELELMNRIVNSGETRKTRSGRMAVVWRINDDNDHR